MGIVSTAMAELKEATVYVKTKYANVPRIHVWDTGDGGTSTTWGDNGSGLPVMTATTLNGTTVYMYTIKFNDTYKFLFKYKDGNQSSNVTGNSTDVYYYWDEGNNTTPTYRGINWVVAGSRQITANHEQWNSTSTNNKMTTTNDETFTLTVTNRPLKAGVTYRYKVVGDGRSWRPNSDKELTVDADGLYDITFSYTRYPESITAVATNYRAKTVAYKYYVWDNESSLTGNAWEDNEMTIDGTNAFYDVNEKALSAATYKYKVVERTFVDGVKENDYWPTNSEDPAGDGSYTWVVTTATNGDYDITFNYDISSETINATASKGYYLVKSGSPWTVGDRMTSKNGVWSGTISDWAGKYFAVIAAQNKDVFPGNWTGVVRPSGSSDYVVNFQACSGSTGGTKTWKAADGNDGKITIDYTPSSNTWSIGCTREAEIGDAGYITYSNGEKCTVSGAEAIYVVSENNTNSVHLEEKAAATVWPASEGMILKGTKGDKITINAVASGTDATTIGTNYLVGTGNSETKVTVLDPNTTIYVFSWDGTNTSSVGFYKADATGNLGAHKAYLDLSRSSFNAREDFLGFNFGEDETDGIDAAKVNVISGTAYNLAGQKVGANYKGIVIVNGKKVVRK